MNNQWVKQIREEGKKFLGSNENENNTPAPLEYRKGSAKRKVYSYEGLH
jgi:hypothetical protein